MKEEGDLRLCCSQTDTGDIRRSRTSLRTSTSHLPVRLDVGKEVKSVAGSAEQQRAVADVGQLWSTVMYRLAVTDVSSLISADSF